MSFSVVGSTQPTLSPHAAAYGAGAKRPPGPPPFSLSATNGNDLVDMLGSAPMSAHAKRMGTDPTKFKTTICRNWEQTGMCGFRGCTFAHGVDDLRPPHRCSQLGTPGHGGTSPQLGPKISPNSSPALGGNGATATASSTHNGMVNTTRLDVLVDQLVCEVAKDKDMLLIHQEASRTLEAMFRKENGLKQGAGGQVADLAAKLLALVRRLKEKNASLSGASDRPEAVALEASITRLLKETPPLLADVQDTLERAGVTVLVTEEIVQPRPQPPRSYAAAVSRGRSVPTGLQPIGGSPSDDSLPK